MRRAPTLPPRPLDRLIGRDRDLAALAAEAARSALVVVVGPPGVGKTRLALEYARRSAERGAAVTVCDLTECATGADIVVRVSGALRVATTDVAAGLAAGPRLLVLDNAEHIVDEVGRCLAVWLDAAPALRTIVTSRARLHVAGEVVFDLAPLDDAAAIDLFVDRARAVRRDDGPDPVAIPELVRRLDGLPLAIELAAARSRLYEPAQLLAELGRSLDLFATTGPRARSLAAALELSWSLLSAAEQAALTQASVFRGGFTVAAAEAVIDLDGAPIAPALEALIDHSLIWSRRLGTERRLGLYVVVRELAAARLSPASAAAARARHAAWFLAAGATWARGVPGPDAPVAVARIAADAENLLAIHRRALDDGDGPTALEAALILDPLFQTRGPIDHAIAVLDGALALVPADAPRRLDALESRANALRYLRAADARAAFAVLRDAAVAAGSRRHEARARSGLAVMGWLLGDPASEAELGAALAMQHELGDGYGESVTLTSLGHLVLHRGDLAVAREHFARALALVTELGDARQQGIHHGNLGLVEQECGRLESARVALERSLAIFRGLDARRDEAWALLNLADLAYEEGRCDAARPLYREAQARNEEIGNRRSQGIVLAHLAALEHGEGALPAARALFERAIAALEAAGSAMSLGLGLASYAALLADLGLVADARGAFDRADEALRAAGDETGAAALAVARGHLDLAGGDADTARRRALEALAHIDRWPVRFARIGLERALARAAVPAPAPPALEPSLTVGVDARWFEVEGGERVDLTRRRALRLVLAALAAARRDRPGVALDVGEVLAAGWPGEVVLPEAGASRVYVAVATLRRMGLRELLVRTDAGYLIDPAVSFRII